ncbi:YfiR family protein [bacterium]|nr:YfiR family protein [bacterium]
MINILKKIILILLLLSSSFSSDSIKITLIEKISQFIQWPKLNEEFIIGVYKNEQLKNEMIEIYKNKTIQKLPIKVYNIQSDKDNELNKLNLIYFNKELSTDIEKILKKINKSPVLIITEYPNDVYENMHLGLYYENQKIKFIINQQSLENVNLKASYKILKLAKLVKVEK